MPGKAHDLFDAIASFPALHAAALRAATGKRRKPGVAAFLANLETEVLRLERELRTGRYRPGRYKTIEVFDPKHRVVSAAPFRPSCPAPAGAGRRRFNGSGTMLRRIRGRVPAAVAFTMLVAAGGADGGQGWIDALPLVSGGGGHYEGARRDGQPHGQGVMVSPEEGWRYEGEFSAGRLHGYGVRTPPRISFGPRRPGRAGGGQAVGAMTGRRDVVTGGRCAPPRRCR